MAAVSRATVGRALAEEHEPTYLRALGGSSFDGFAAGVRWLLASTPMMPAATIDDRRAARRLCARRRCSDAC